MGSSSISHYKSAEKRFSTVLLLGELARAFLHLQAPQKSDVRAGTFCAVQGMGSLALVNAASHRFSGLI